MAETSQQRVPARRLEKSAAAFRTISEVANALDVPPHVLRFWESKFVQIKPLKRGGGRRYYRPEDIDLLRTIRELLYTDGYTIKGVQKLLREGGARSIVRSSPRPRREPEPQSRKRVGEDTAPAVAATGSNAPAAARRTELGSILSELESMRDLLRRPVD